MLLVTQEIFLIWIWQIHGGYCDQLIDFESYNYYMRARYYNTETGRFISEDTHWNPSNMIYGDSTFEENETKYPDITASLQASNLYGYCMGNPVIYSDINGNAFGIDKPGIEFERSVWKTVANVFAKRGYILTSRLLELSVSGQENPKFYASDGTYAANAIKGSSDFRKAVNDLIYAQGIKLGKNTINVNSSYNWTTGNGDIGAALHRFDFNVTGSKINGKWEVKVTVTDVFDFSENVNPFLKSEIKNGIVNYLKGVCLWIGNDIAYFDQYNGVIKPVDVMIQYNDTFL